MPVTVLAALPAALIEAAVELGLRRHALLAAAGLDDAALADPDNRVPFPAHARLWEAIAASGVDDIGMAIGARIGRGGLGVVGHAMKLAPTVGEAWACLERYRRVVLEDAVPRLQVSALEARFVQPLPPRFARLRHPAECAATATLMTLKGLTGAKLRVKRMAFQHAAPPDTSGHRAVFGVLPDFGAQANVLVVDPAVLALPNRHRDAALQRYLMRHADRLQAGVGSDERFADAVRRALAADLERGEPQAAGLARSLAVSVRTLHRRLALEGTSFGRILDEARRERALALVADRGLRIGEIAYLLGYAEPTSFARAFRRWTKRSPQAWRESLSDASTARGTRR